jgi:competence protein ComEC
MRAMIGQQTERWVLWVPVFFGAGALCYYSLPFEPMLYVGMAGFFFATLCFFACLWKLPKLVKPMIGLLFLAAGFGMASWHAYRVDTPRIAEELGPIWVHGTVVSKEQRATDVRVILDAVDLWRYPIEDTPPRIRLNVRTKMDGVQVGDRVSVKAVLLPPPRPVYPGGYDFGRWAFFRSIGAVGYAVTGMRVKQECEGGECVVSHSIARLRDTITERILSYGTSTEKPTEAAIAAALLTGVRGNIPKTVVEEMRISGLGHLLAISGLHLVLITGACFFVVRALLALMEPVALRFHIKKWAALVAIAAGAFYLMISGAPVSAQRAFIMVLLFFLAMLLDRTGTPMRPVAWAALIILLLAPHEVLSASFQMSFSAALGLVAFFEAIKWLNKEYMGHFSLRRKIGYYVLGLLASSLVAGSATAPFAVYHFGRYAPFGVVANLTAIPLATLLIMPSGLLTLVLMPFGLEGVGLWFMTLGIGWVVEIAQWVTHLPGAHMGVVPPSNSALILYVLGFVWLCVWRGKVRMLGVVPMVIAAVIGLVAPRPDILLAEKGMYALRGADGVLYFSSKQKGRFARDQWLEQDGDVSSGKKINKNMKAFGDMLTCEKDVCVYTKAGKRVRIGGDATACSDADMFIFPTQKSTCAGVVIDVDAVEKNGTTTIGLMKKGATIQTVEGLRGTRRWTAPMETRKK